ncbi:hypothetical protein BT93_L0161 [Corymbia citriodora subsp. variegata]|uniref:Uncharacterized protein n=1 Tax=Corymbia citriodora subsp. variegata TaxID=360336 RepID=A0A8T0CQG7_CORYI|nr:hypothetical protein BT93_L0161 [Corymbia citriodora subsp. variegata]
MWHRLLPVILNFLHRNDANTVCQGAARKTFLHQGHLRMFLKMMEQYAQRNNE